MRITSKLHELNHHLLHATLKTASHRFALMVDNYSPDDTEAENGLLMVTGKVFVPGYTDATVTIVYPKRKRSTDQSFYYITPTESTEDMSLAYSDDTFYPQFSKCEQAVKDLPEVTVSQYFYDKGIVPDDPSTFTALTGIPLESSLVEDINEITGEDDAYYPPEGSNLQNLLNQGILVPVDPTIPYYSLILDSTVAEGISASHIFNDPAAVTKQIIIILKRSDQHTEYNTSESTGDANGWDLVITSTFAPDTIQTLSWDSSTAMDNDLQSERLTNIIRREATRYGFIYCSEISYQAWVEQYNNNFLTLASHEADMALEDNFDEAINNNDPWSLKRNDDGTLQYIATTFHALGIDREANLIFATKEGIEFCETLCDHIENEKSRSSSPLFTVDSITLKDSSQTPIIACIYNDTETGHMYYLPLPSALAATLGMTHNLIQQLESIQSAAHDIDSLIQTVVSGEEDKQTVEERPTFAPTDWTQSSDTPNRWISPLYTAPNEPTCTYQIIWDASVEQETAAGDIEYARPYDILYHTLDGRTINGFIERTSYILGGPTNSGNWESLAEPMRQMLLWLNTIDRVNNSTPALPIDEQIELLKNNSKPYLRDAYQELPDYWKLLTGSSKPNNLDSFILRDQKLEGKYIHLYDDKFATIVWDPEATGYETPLSIHTSDESISSLLTGLPWDIVFQSTAYSEEPHTIAQVADAFQTSTIESIGTIIANNLIRLLNQTLELPNQDTNDSWLETQEKYMGSLTSFTKVNGSTSDQLMYDYTFSEEQLNCLTIGDFPSYLKSATLRLIFDGSRQELTPELIAIAHYDDNVKVTIQNTQLSSTFSDIIGDGILAGLSNEKDSIHLERELTAGAFYSSLKPCIYHLAKGQKQLETLERETALVEMAECLDAKENIPWNYVHGSGFTSSNIFWYCKQYIQDPYVSSTLTNCLDSFADALQSKGWIPAPNSRTLAGSIKNEYYLPVVAPNKNMLTGYVELQLSAAKNEQPAFVDDSTIHFMTGNTFMFEDDEGNEVVTFGNDEQPGFIINEELEKINNLFTELPEDIEQPIRLLEEIENAYQKYCEDNQLYSQEYMDQYYSEGLLAHHIKR